MIGRGLGLFPRGWGLIGNELVHIRHDGDAAFEDGEGVRGSGDLANAQADDQEKETDRAEAGDKGEPAFGWGSGVSIDAIPK